MSAVKKSKANIFQRPRPPRVIHLMGHKIKVKLVEELVDDDHDFLHGAYDGDKKTIFLSKQSEWRSTLLHEILHCVFHLSGASEGLTMTKEEQLVLAAEFGLGPLLF